MATWGDQTCQRFEATAVGFETGFSRLRARPSNRYAIAPHISGGSLFFDMSMVSEEECLTLITISALLIRGELPH